MVSEKRSIDFKPTHLVSLYWIKCYAMLRENENAVVHGTNKFYQWALPMVVRAHSLAAMFIPYLQTRGYKLRVLGTIE